VILNGHRIPKNNTEHPAARDGAKIRATPEQGVMPNNNSMNKPPAVLDGARVLKYVIVDSSIGHTV